MYIKVKVQAGAKKELFEQIETDHFKIAVKQKAQLNMANKRVLELVAKHFRLSGHKVRLISGHHSPSKIFSVEI